HRRRARPASQTRPALRLLPPASLEQCHRRPPAGGRMQHCRSGQEACAHRGAEADMPVVTIARLLGSRGDEIGRALADRLNYRYLDHRLLLDYVREFGEVEANAPEIAETRPSFWERLNEERRRHAIVVRCGVYGFAKDDDAVIVGLGGN